MSSVPRTCCMLCLILKILCLTLKIILGYNQFAATSGLRKMRYLWYPWKHTLGTKLCVCFTYKKNLISKLILNNLTKLFIVVHNLETHKKMPHRLGMVWLSSRAFVGQVWGSGPHIHSVPHPTRKCCFYNRHCVPILVIDLIYNI